MWNVQQQCGDFVFFMQVVVFCFKNIGKVFTDEERRDVLKVYYTVLLLI